MIPMLIKQCKRSCYSLNCRRFEHWLIYYVKEGLWNKWVFKNKKDDGEGIVVSNKQDLVDKVTPKEEALIVMRWIVKSAFCFGTIEEEVYMMYKKFQMSSMGELTFFLGLQVKQKDNGIFISQDKVVKATTTAASLDATQASGDRRCQEVMRGVIAQTRSERSSKHSYDSPLLEGNTPGSDEERIEQDDLIDFVPPIPHDSPLSGGHTPGK
ncbi:hypothetical protein Tco_1125208 [Tanacetum coccineum]|uniref:Reverse transcriptase Ty1/copia-type domain-containing protein n=1 Tax=Tanacetum coccineum TaxID=301880 RepID=A0ABQ5JBD4_9ASTR